MVVILSRKNILLVFVTLIFSIAEGQKKNGNGTRVKYRYPVLYRDHIFDTLTDMGKEMFYAVDIQPSCKAKRGYCIPRAMCNGKDMLYISRICYKQDMVCCYDGSIRFPEVADKHYTSATQDATEDTTDQHFQEDINTTSSTTEPNTTTD